MTRSEIKNLPRHKASDADLVPAIPGVYFLLRHSRIIYIGCSSNLRCRLAAHDVPFDEFKYCRTKGDSYRRALERQAIALLKPTLNNRTKRHLFDTLKCVNRRQWRTIKQANIRQEVLANRDHLSVSTLRKHLMKLTKLELVQCRRVGREKLWRRI